MSDPWRILVRRTGGPEVLTRVPLRLAPPAPGQARIRHTAIGVNFIDTYYRSGLYPMPLPGGLGSEAAGVVESIGEGVRNVRPGDRVVWLGGETYATDSNVPADSLHLLPDTIEDDVAAAILLKGITAWMLVERIAKAGPGQIVLVHAAAGGVGSLLVPWLKSAGAIVIAHAGSDAKAAKALALGADHALADPFETLAASVRALTDGRGVDVVLDGIGAASWAASLATVTRRGLMVSYGNASGPVPPLRVAELVAAGSIFLTRPSLYDYIDTADLRAQAVARLFALLSGGTLTAEIGQRFALTNAAGAHRALEARTTIASTILIP